MGSGKGLGGVVKRKGSRSGSCPRGPEDALTSSAAARSVSRRRPVM